MKGVNQRNEAAEMCVHTIVTGEVGVLEDTFLLSEWKGERQGVRRQPTGLNPFEMCVLCCRITTCMDSHIPARQHII